MKSFALRLVLVIGVFGVWLAGEAPAAEAPRTERVPAMREPVYRQLAAAREQVDREDFAKALESLDRLRGQPNLNSYERAMAWNLYAFVHYSREDYAQAVDAYRKVLEQRPIPESLENATLYGLAQMYVVTGKYTEALEALNDWFARIDEPNAGALMLLGQVHYQLGDFRAAGEAIERAVRDAEARNEEVRENWYLMLRAIRYAEKDYRGLAGVLQKLARLYPKREYWVQLSAVYGELGDERRQVATLETAYEQGMLERESEYVMLAQLLMANGVPWKAGKVLEAGLANGVIEPEADTLRLVADAWVLAKEYDRGIAALERAARLKGSGELDLRLAQVLLEMERNRDALEAVRTALEKGGLEKPETAHIVAGLALYNLEQLEAAAESFARAASAEPANETAAQWLRFIDRERARRAALENAMEGAPVTDRAS